jgi:hypothetical protein
MRLLLSEVPRLVCLVGCCLWMWTVWVCREERVAQQGALELLALRMHGCGCGLFVWARSTKGCCGGREVQCLGWRGLPLRLLGLRRCLMHA